MKNQFFSLIIVRLSSVRPCRRIHVLINVVPIDELVVYTCQISVTAASGVGLCFFARLVIAGGSASSRVWTWFDSTMITEA